MDEWNAIDLHMHTASGFTRDKSNDTVIFTYLDFVKVLKKYNMKLMAVTNHNYIDFANYILMKYLGKKCDTNILLGVELDSKLSMGTHIHIAVIFNTFFNSNFEVSIMINNTTKSKLKNKEIFYNDDEVIDLLKKYDLIMIPHGNKDKGIFKNANYEQIREALKKISEGFIRIFDSPSDWKLSRIKGFLNEIEENNLDNFGGVLFSDNRDWTQYEKNFRNFYMNAEPTFKGLIHSTANPVGRFKPYNEISKNSNYITTIKIEDLRLHTDRKLSDCEIKLSSGFNCIIGKSGSGKSLLLHIIKQKLTNNDPSADKYAFINNTKVEIYNENGVILSPDNINLSIGENLFDKIITATTTNDYNDYYRIIALLNPEFQKMKKFIEFVNNYNNKLLIYIKLHNQINNNLENLKEKLVEYNTKTLNLERLIKVKVFDVSYFNKKPLTYSENIINQYKNYSTDIKQLNDKIELYKGKYKTQIQEKITELEKILDLAFKEMELIQIHENLENKKIDIINNAIKHINSCKSVQTQIKANLQQEIPHLRDQIAHLVLDTYINKTNLVNINLTIDVNNINNKSEISNDRSVVVEENIIMDNITQVSEKENVLFKTYGCKKFLDDKIYNMTSKVDARNLINKYIEVGVLDESNSKLADTFKPEVNIFFDGQNIKELNPGDIAKKYIQIYFKDQLINGKNNVVLFDQIENDVDKTFINTVIKELIEGTKGKVQLLIVTHDPIVAVNADPNRYIQSNKIDNKISYRDFVAESSIKDELDTIACNVDGSKQVIHDRYEIYKGDKLHGN